MLSIATATCSMPTSCCWLDAAICVAACAASVTLPASDWIDYLEALELTKQSAVLSEKLGDLYAGLGKPSSAVHAYENALKLDPSPQQKIRLRLTLGEKLAELKREQEAYNDYQQLLKEAPAYPGKAMVETRISELGRKLANSSR